MRDKVTGRHVAVPLIERFWPKVLKTDGCWLWQANLNKHGYGLICVGRRKFYAHRVSWEFANGPVPDGLKVLHHCDTPACVRVDHLFVGTQADNMYDMQAKGRQRAGAGEHHRLAVLTDAAIADIRARYRTGKNAGVLASEYGVTPTTIWRVGVGRTWRHISL